MNKILEDQIVFSVTVKASELQESSLLLILQIGQLVGKLGRENIVIYMTFGSVCSRLGQKNGVFGQAWTLLGHCLDAVWRACFQTFVLRLVFSNCILERHVKALATEGLLWESFSDMVFAVSGETLLEVRNGGPRFP